ncbi:MAG: SGNH/GDSL hydrolase family protein [Ottowia sp.]|nr:SGNH/GDSL hydrolase family protein [Ottowia sp.]
MNASWPARIARLLAVTAATLALASCGGESVISDLKPERFLVVGDDMMDVGQNGYVYTINDGSKTWVQTFAGHYGLTVESENNGGWGFAQGGARISAPSEAPSVTAQVDEMLDRTTLGKNDVVLIGGGQSDIVAAVQELGISKEATTAVQQAGTELAQQVRRVVAAGATHVAVVGSPLVGDTPWARAQNQEKAINDLSVAFNNALLLGIHDMGDTVIYLDAALFFDLLYDDASNHGFSNGKDPVCTTPDVTTCTAATVRDANYNRWLFADDKHFTPEALRLFGTDEYSESGFSRFDDRW